MGDIFYRGVSPSRMGYAELRYYSRWHDAIRQEEIAAVKRAQASAGE